MNDFLVLQMFCSFQKLLPWKGAYRDLMRDGKILLRSFCEQLGETSAVIQDSVMREPISTLLRQKQDGFKASLG